MFTPFFTLLRARGLSVSLNEWFTLNEALDRGLGCAGLSDFYFLCRSVLIKSETDYSAYHRAFLEYFWEVIEASEQPLPDNLLRWLDRPSVNLDNFDPEAAKSCCAPSSTRFAGCLRSGCASSMRSITAETIGSVRAGCPASATRATVRPASASGDARCTGAPFEVAGERQFEDFRQDTGHHAAAAPARTAQAAAVFRQG